MKHWCFGINVIEVFSLVFDSQYVNIDRWVTIAKTMSNPSMGK